MTKASGLGANFYIAGYNISGDTGELSEIGGGNDPLVVTGIDKSAIERLGGKRDGRMAWSTFFNDADDQEHEALAGMPRTDVLATYLHRPTIGAPAANMVAKQLNYDATRGQDGSLTFGVSAEANAYGLEWGDSLGAGPVTVTGNGSQASLDYGASVGTTAFGAQAYLQVFNFAGTGLICSVQHSSDNGGADAWADLITFSVSAAGKSWQRAATATPTTSVERYLRASVVAFPSFSTFTYHLSVVRNLVASAVF